MKIVELHIYGYGKLENVTIHINNHQVLYGQNEAGKTTLMSFIHSMLFGFPTKQQSISRYEPKNHSKYGGKLVMELEGSDGEVIVERVKGKATGDVTVMFHDGRIEGEEYLTTLLNGMDRLTFENIFSFNLNGLQDIHRIREEDLNRFLFSAGSTGADTLLALEDTWEKEQSQLFKKSGKKPEINQLIHELRVEEKALKVAKDKNQEYKPLQDDKQRIIAENKQLEGNLEKLEENLIQHKELVQAWDLYQEYYVLKEKLERLKEYESFPSNGLNRYKTLIERRNNCQLGLETLQKKHQSLKEKCNAFTPNSLIVDKYSTLESLVSNYSHVVSWQERLADISRRLSHTEEQINDSIRELDLSIKSYEDIISIDTSMVKSEEVKTLLDQRLQLEHQVEQVRKSEKIEIVKLQKLEEKCSGVERELLEEGEFQSLVKKKKQLEEQQKKSEKIEWLTNQIRILEGQKSSSSLIPVLFFTLSISVGVWGMLQRDWFLSIIGCVTAILSIFQFLRNRQNKNHSLIQSLRQEVASIQSDFVDEAEREREFVHIENTFEEQVRLREEWKHWIVKIEEANEICGEISKERESLDSSLNQSSFKIIQVLNSLNLPRNLHWTMLDEAYRKIKDLIKKCEQYKQLHNEKVFFEEKLEEFQADCKLLVESVDVTYTSISETVIRIKDILYKHKENQLAYSQYVVELSEVEETIQQNTTNLNSILRDIKNLKESVEVVDDEAFLSYGKAHEQYVTVKDRVLLLYQQLGERILFLGEKYEEKSEIQLQLHQLQQSLQEYKNKLKNNQEHLAEIQYKMDRLEEGTEYTKQLYRYYEKKEELNALAKRWATFAIAQKSLQKTIEHYKRDRLPTVIKNAEYYFSILTRERYTSIFVYEENEIQVRDKNGQLFKSNELSQGTKEQLYLSFRLALVRFMKKRFPLPIIIDDGLVNFDIERATSFIQLLETEFKDQQFLFFTCHEHIATAFKQSGFLNLETDLLKSVAVN